VELAGKTAGNQAVQETLLRAQRPLEQGKRLSEVLAGSGQVPPLALSMLLTGEESGNIDATMNKVADYFEAEASASLKKLTVAIVPLAVLIFGVVILFQLVGFYQGYFGAVLNQ
jgi:type IV pilus assembly protein PilC